MIYNAPFIAVCNTLWIKYDPAVRDGVSSEALWLAFVQVAFSVAAIFGFIYGMGQLFFGSVLWGYGLIAVGTISLIVIVRNLNKSFV